MFVDVYAIFHSAVGKVRRGAFGGRDEDDRRLDDVTVNKPNKNLHLL